MNKSKKTILIIFVLPDFYSVLNQETFLGLEGFSLRHWDKLFAHSYMTQNNGEPVQWIAFNQQHMTTPLQHIDGAESEPEGNCDRKDLWHSHTMHEVGNQLCVEARRASLWYGYSVWVCVLPPKAMTYICKLKTTSSSELQAQTQKLINYKRRLEMKAI